MVANSPLPPQSDAIRILIADDHPVVRLGVGAMLSHVPGFVVVGQAEDGMAAVDLAISLRPDLLLLDVAMPRLPGIEALRAVLRQMPEIKVVLLTASARTQQLVEALQVGARGIVLKNAASDDLVSALRVVLAGNYWVGGKAVKSLKETLHELLRSAGSMDKRKTFGMTSRELELVGCIVDGCANIDAAKQLGITEETVKRHLSNIFNKTGVSTRLELAMFAIAHRVVVPDDLPSHSEPQ